MERLIEASDLEPPQAMVDEQLEARSREVVQGLTAQGLDEAAAAEELSRQEGQLRAQALKGAKAYFLIEALAEREKLKVSEQELAAELRSIARRNQTSFEEVSQFYKEQNLFPQLAMEIVERKVKTFLRESAALRQPG
jgi:trigger factor